MISFSSFVDEVEKIKEAGVLRDVGSAFVRTARGVGKNLAGSAGTITRPVQALKEGVRATADSMKTPGWEGKVNTALLVGGTAAMLPSVLRKEDSSGDGASRLARGTRYAGGTIGSLMTAPFGLTGGIAGGIAGDVAGKYVGKAIDKARGFRRPQPVPPSAPANPPGPATALTHQSTVPNP